MVALEAGVAGGLAAAVPHGRSVIDGFGLRTRRA
jgi:hypothetical protein